MERKEREQKQVIGWGRKENRSGHVAIGECVRSLIPWAPEVEECKPDPLDCSYSITLVLTVILYLGAPWTCTSPHGSRSFTFPHVRWEIERDIQRNIEKHGDLRGP